MPMHGLSTPSFGLVQHFPLGRHLLPIQQSKSRPCPTVECLLLPFLSYPIFFQCNQACLVFWRRREDEALPIVRWYDGTMVSRMGPLSFIGATLLAQGGACLSRRDAALPESDVCLARSDVADAQPATEQMARYGQGLNAWSLRCVICR